MSTRPLQQQFELVSSLAKRDLKVRYKDSVLGFFWSLFRPAFLTLILWIVFSHIVRVPFTSERVPYWFHVLVSVLTWNFIVGSLYDASGSLLANANLLKKVRLDAEVLPIATIVANAVHFVLALVIVLILVVVLGIGLSWEMVFLPVVALVLATLILGLALVVSALNVFYRDVGSLLELGTLAWFYVTPIIYPLGLARQEITMRAGEAGFALYMLNPAAPIVTAMRRVLFAGAGETEIPDAELVMYLGVSAVLSLVLAVGGWLLFRRLSERFADEL